jgi:hypothetical protein
MKKKLISTITAMVVSLPVMAAAEDCEPSRWTVTLEMLEPLTYDERQAVLVMLGIEMDPVIINQAIAEGQVPLEAFGGE